MKTLIIAIAFLLGLGLAVQAEATDKCTTILLANEDANGKLTGYYYHYSFPYGTGSSTCDCSTGVSVQYYVGAAITYINLNSPITSCTPGSAYVYQTFQANQTMPPAGAFFEYGHGSRTWRAHCGKNASNKVSCDQSGVEYDD
jgi:hypothetical protein